MIVVAIIVLLAAIAIPNLLRARLNANEAASIASLRTLSTALESFRAAQAPPAYPAALADLGPGVSDPPYVDATLAGGSKQGYNFAYAQVSNNEYTVTGSPVTPGVTGSRTFFVDESGVIRINDAAGDPIE